MTLRRSSARAVAFALASMLALLVGTSAQATTTYTDVVGANYTYTGGLTITNIQETSSFGDPEPLFDQPVLSGANDLAFNPTTFIASGSAGAFDQTGSQLQLVIKGNTASDFIETVLLTEAGTVDLTGAGTAGTGAFAGMSGFVTVFEIAGVAVAPVVLPGFIGAPSVNLNLVSNPGQTSWSMSATIDVAFYYANVTGVLISWDNDLTVFTEAGSMAVLEKTSAGISLPEPGTAVLLGAGLLVAGFGARREER